MFGMGTGGSLRLLSPETKQGLVPFAAAFLLTSVRPSNGLPTAFESLQLQALTHCVSHPQNRTGWIVFGPTKTSFNPRILSQTISSVSLRLSLSVPFPPLSLWFVLLLPTPSSLLPALQDQALDRLVSSSSIHYCTSTDDLSTLSSSRGLTCF